MHIVVFCGMAWGTAFQSRSGKTGLFSTTFQCAPLFRAMGDSVMSRMTWNKGFAARHLFVNENFLPAPSSTDAEGKKRNIQPMVAQPFLKINRR